MQYVPGFGRCGRITGVGYAMNAKEAKDTFQALYDVYVESYRQRDAAGCASAGVWSGCALTIDASASESMTGVMCIGASFIVRNAAQEIRFHPAPGDYPAGSACAGSGSSPESGGIAAGSSALRECAGHSTWLP